MTTENDFQAALDEQPDAHHLRLVFADWLQDRDDPRAQGYRALGALRKYPMCDRRHVWNEKGQRWNKRRIKVWVWMETVTGRGSPAQLKERWCKLLPVHAFPSRREAEDAAALAFARLPADRRAELLVGVPA